MFLGVLITVLLNISNYLPHPELRDHSIQIVVVILTVSIKRFDCVLQSCMSIVIYLNLNGKKIFKRQER